MDSRKYLSLSTEELVIKRFECKNKNEMNLIDTLLKVREREEERKEREKERERKEREEERQLEFARIQIQMKKLEIQMSIGNNPSSSN